MSIAAAIVLTQDDTDVCINAVKSAAIFCDEIYVIDTGAAVLRRNVKQTNLTVRDFCTLMCDVSYPVTYTSINWGKGDHALVKNQARAFLDRYDWCFWIDSDEMATFELANRLRDLSFELPPDVVTVASKLLTLYPDQEHYSPYYSNTLSHGRMYRPKMIEWRGAWHEHQDYKGKRLDIEQYHLHFRQLFANRCWRQHNHGPDAWPHISDDVRPVSELEATWQPIVYPLEDRCYVG